MEENIQPPVQPIEMAPPAPAPPSFLNEDFSNKLDSRQAEEIWDGRRRMAWVALAAMIIPTLYIIGFVTNVDLMDKMGDLMSWFYLALASIVCAYFGFRSWSSIRGK